MRLHIHPGTSGLAPHMALLATGAPFELATLDLFRGEARTPAFLAMNPFGTVPVLEDDGETIPETGAILLHLAERFPEASLLPHKSRSQALRWLFHAAALHADFMTWRRAMLRLKAEPQALEVVQTWMTTRLASAFRATEQGMVGPYLTGPIASAADLYVFMVAGWWATRFAFAAETPRLAQSLRALSALPHVRDAYAAQHQDLPAF